VKKFEDTFIRFDIIHEREGRTDRQTHRQTSHDGIDRAYPWHRAAKMPSHSGWFEVIQNYNDE